MRTVDAKDRNGSSPYRRYHGGIGNGKAISAACAKGNCHICFKLSCPHECHKGKDEKTDRNSTAGRNTSVAR